MKKLFLLSVFALFTLCSNAWDFNNNYFRVVADKVRTGTCILSDFTWEGTDSWKRRNSTYGYMRIGDRDQIRIDTRDTYKLSYYKDPIYTVKGSKVTMKGLYIGKYHEKENEEHGWDETFYKAFVSLGRTDMYYIKSLTVYYSPLDNSSVRLTAGAGHSCTSKKLENTQDVENYALTVNPFIPCTHVPLYCDKEEFNTGSELAQYNSDFEYSGVIVTKIDVEYYQSEDYRESFNFMHTYYLDQKYTLDKAENNKFLTEALSQRTDKFQKGDVNEDKLVNSADVVEVYNKIINGSSTIKLGHEYVDLGIPSGKLWATCNVGASYPEEFGDYFSFQEFKKSYLNGKPVFNEPIIYPEVDFTAKPEGWYGGWIVPDIADYQELFYYTTFKYGSRNGVYGAYFTGKNGNSLFLPFSGTILEDGLYNNDQYSDFLVSTIYLTSSESGEKNCYCVSFGSDAPDFSSTPKYYGHPLRMCYKP